MVVVVWRRRPVYLDNDLLLLRSAVLDSTVFVWTRLGADDPPDAEVPLGEEEAAGLPASLRAALAAGGKKGGNRPQRRDMWGRAGGLM